MGLGGISIWQLLIILAIVVLLFGTKKLRTLGGDLGSALKSFKGALKDGEEGKGEDTLEADVPSKERDPLGNETAAAQRKESAESRKN